MKARSRRRSLSKYFAVAAVGLLLAACANSTPSGGSSGKGGPYVIGSTSDLSSFLAFEGSGLRNGINAYFTYVNKHGGVNGHKIDYIPLDDKSNPATGAANVTQLVTVDNAIAVLGWGLSDVLVAAQSELKRYHVAAIGQALTGGMVNPPQPGLVSAELIISSEAGLMAKFAEQKLVHSSHPTVAIVTYDSSVDVKFRANLVAIARAQGWKVVSNLVMSLSATGYSAQVNALTAAKPDFILSSVVDPTLLGLVGGIRQAGLTTTPVVNYDGGAAYGTLKQLNDPNVYVLRPFALPTDTKFPGIRTFDAAVKAVGANPAAPFVINGYVQAMIAVAALKRCGYPCSAQKFMSSLNNLGTVQTGGVTVAPALITPSVRALTHGVIYGWNTKTHAPYAASGVLSVS
ncbi:MAG: ABC transporter substrate-binding protein [Acidimicrobiales bacterium]